MENSTGSRKERSLFIFVSAKINLLALIGNQRTCLNFKVREKKTLNHHARLDHDREAFQRISKHFVRFKLLSNVLGRKCFH